MSAAVPPPGRPGPAAGSTAGSAAGVRGETSGTDDPPVPGGPPVIDGRPAPADLAARLVAQREAAGMSIDDVASRTRIRPSLIRAMEAGDFAPCGGAVYARGHLRSMAGVTGGDAPDLLAAYDRMAGAPSPSTARVPDQHHEMSVAPVPFAVLSAPTGPSASSAPPGAAPRAGAQTPEPVAPLPLGGSSLVLPGADRTSDRRASPWMLAALVVTVAVIVVAVVALVARKPATRPTAAPPSPVHASASVASPSRVAAPSTAGSTTTPTTGGVTVVVTVTTASSWVHVVDGTGALLFQGVLPPGTTRSFHAPTSLAFRFGNAPAVDLSYDGRDLGSPSAASGVVAEATFPAPG